ncbi:carbohydrate ABC transporter permease [Paenibacillus gansuensis]|uniref:Carbohydrate ABC transporter permease n=1 Tax=Paenibacillus gansuensis TaxID=306542 RepID=A0ABW5PLD4_9BACL
MNSVMETPLSDRSRKTGLRLKRKRSRTLAMTASYLVLTAGALIILIPFFWMLSTSLKEKVDVYKFPPEWIPSPAQWHNFPDALTTFPFPLYTFNTAIIVFFVLIGTLLSCSLASFGFARLSAPGRDFIFMLLLATMMLPYAVTMVPLYILFNKLGWINTFLPLIVPSWFGNAFYIFLMRQFFMSIPRELEESARIDGCSTFMIWLRILVPLTRPVMVTVGVFTFMATWNDFMTPLIYLTDESKRTLALALSYFQGSARSSPELHLLMAATIYAVAPCLILYFTCQRIFVKGIVFTGVKG